MDSREFQGKRTLRIGYLMIGTEGFQYYNNWYPSSGVSQLEIDPDKINQVRGQLQGEKQTTNKQSRGGTNMNNHVMYWVVFDDF